MHFTRAMELSGGSQAGPLISLAENVCVQKCRKVPVQVCDDSCDNGCGKEGFFGKLKGRMGCKKGGDCCDSGCSTGCATGGCSSGCCGK